MGKSAKETVSLIPSIFYRGPENFVNIIGTSRTNYVFSRETDYTVEPVTWEDFYEILLVDRFNIRDRLFVLADDPTKATNLRRVAPDEVEISQDIYDAQAKVDSVSKKETELTRLKNEYIGRINLQIAHGSLDAIPEHLEDDAQAYADAQYASQTAEEVVTEETVVVDTPVIVDPTVETTPVVDTPVVDTPPVVTTPDTPVETVPSVETPVVETPEVLENAPTPSVDPVTEPTDVVATDAPVVENPVVAPSDTTETPIETPSEVKVETTVEETPVQAGPTTRKRSS